MEQFVKSFEDRKGVLFVLFIALLFSIFIAITGFKIKNNSRVASISLILLGFILSLIILIAMYTVLMLGINF